MAMPLLKADAETNVLEVVDRIEKFAMRAKVSFRMVLVDQMALWAADLLKMSWPRKKKDGVAAIKSDLNDLFDYVDPADQITPAWTEPSTSLITRNATGSTYAARSDRIKYTASIADVRAIHASRRSKLGRVYPERMGAFGSIPKSNRWQVSRRVGKQLFRELSYHVGRLKSGWLRVAEYFGSQARRSYKAPDWVRRAYRGESSTSSDTLTGRIYERFEGVLRGSNKVPYAGLKLQGLVDATRRTRENDLANHARKRLNQVKKRFNL